MDDAMDDGDRSLVSRAGARLAAAPLESERVLSTLAIELIRLPLDDLDAGLHRALARLGATAAADRSYLLELDADGDRIARVVEWAAPGVASHAERMVGAPLAAFAWAAPRLLAGALVTVDDVEALPGEAVAEQAEARAQGTRAFCMVPIVSGDRTLGALGFDAVYAPRCWTADDGALLRRSAAMFCNAIERRALESQARHQRDFLTLLAPLATEFINLPLGQIDHGIRRALRQIGTFSGVDRAFVFLRDREPHPEHGPTMSETHEWCADGVPSVFDRYQYLPAAMVAPQLLHGVDAIYPRDDPEWPVTETERQVCEAEGVQSLICVPLRSASRTEGFLGLVTLRAPKRWTAEDRALLHLAAEMVAGAVDRRRLESAVAQQQRFEQLVATLAAEFINWPVEQTGAAIDRALQRIGEFAGVDRSYVFELDHAARTVANTFEWCAADIAPQRDRIQGAPFEAFPWALQKLLAGEPLDVPDVAALPPDAALERAEFVAQGIRSLACVPLRRANRSVGFLGLDAVRVARRWTAGELTYLRIAAEMFANVLDRRRAEQERARLEAQMRHAQKLESLGVLAGGIAHDFNNLLTTMLGNASLALEALAGDSPARHSLDQVRLAAERARDLTNQMLAYAGRGRVQVESLDLSAVVREMAELLRVSVGRRTRLEFGLAQDLPPIAADVTQVRQVVMNLLTNAAEALPDSGGTVTVRTGTHVIEPAALDGRWVPEDPAAGHYVLLQVADTGGGMDDATRARIFEPFFSTKFAGRGLGLAAVLGIAQSHGGALRVTSAPGRGTEIAMVWPLAARPAAAPAPAPPPASRAAVRGEGTVLVIDDDEGVRRVARDTLQRAGYSVLTAEAGRQGLALFRMHADEIVAVILDLEMPDLDGVGTLAELARVRTDAPVVLSSGYTERDARSRFGASPPRGFLQKPYTAARLRAAVLEARGGRA